MIKKLMIIFLITFFLTTVSSGRSYVSKESSGRTKSERPDLEMKYHTIGEVWSAVSNFGNYGDPASLTPSYDWPGGTANSYHWEGRLWMGAIVEGETLVSHADYGNYELDPSEDSEWKIGTGLSMMDIECEFDDFGPRNSKPMGLKVIQCALAWSSEDVNDFIIYQQKLINTGLKGDLSNVFISMMWDCDISLEDPLDANIDDLVCFDGQILGPGWENFTQFPSPTDNITLLPDSFLSEPDGVYDQYTVFGDEPGEITLNGDTLLVPRNLSYMYDGDNPADPADDVGENGACAGYIGCRLIYAPPTEADSVWIEDGDTLRILRPYSHTWWNWENDPGSDVEKFKYMTCSHGFCEVFANGVYYRFMPHPFDPGAPVFDYRFMLASGPHTIAAGETLEFVWAGLMGQGLNGGYDGYWRNKWVPGIRQNADRALKAYYSGSSQSDPYHPSGPSEDVHWLIPIPPEVPTLSYSAGMGRVTLAWDDLAEITPDPLDKEYDFRGYRVYKSKFRVGEWELLKGFVDADFAGANPDSFPQPLYDYIEEGETFPHSYVDTDIIYGVPYYYTVTSFDSGREPDPPTPAISSLESGKSNYKKDPVGAEVPIYVNTEKTEGYDLSKVTVAPNPYLGSVEWERQYENRIQFMNLPGSCRILIYTLSGDLVRDIDHKDGSGDEYWNLFSRKEQEVVSGLYIYKIETDNGDYKVGKLMILR